MQNIFLHNGVGKPLQAVTQANGNAISQGVFSIPSAGRSEGVSAHDCRELVFAIEFDAAPGAGNIIIERAASLADTVTWETHATISASGKKFFSWAANERLLGFYRVFNSGTSQPCTVKVNKAII